jgi:hypothetical protein
MQSELSIPPTGAPGAPAEGSEIPAEIWSTQEDLSAESVRFLKYALERPEMARRVDHRRMEPPLPDWIRGYPALLQPWPTFVDARKVRQIERATVGLVELVKSIPERLFGGDPRRIRDYYGLRDETLAALMLSPPNGISTCFARCDLIDDGENFKCLELNISGSIGGWQIRFFDRICRSQPGVAAFFAAEKLQAQYPDPWRNALTMVLERGCQQGHDEAGRFNIAVAVSPETTDWEGVIGAMNDLYQEVLRDSGTGCQGEVLKCLYPNDLRARGEMLFYGDRRISAVIEPTSLPTTRDVYRCFKARRVGLFNGPITTVLTSKSNLALLSQNEESDLFTAAEREVIRNNVPWSRLVADGPSTYRGEKINLLDYAVARRDSLVLKPVSGFKGMGVHMGSRTPPAEWLQHLQGTAGTGKVLLQEYVTSRPYLFQTGEQGWAPHQAIWGTFSFGGTYGGSYLRVMPMDRGQCVINSMQQGTTQGLVYEV